jgi:hypothetical protein
MANFRIKPLSSDTDLRSRSLEITINGKPVVTPSRVLYFQPDNDASEARIISKKELRGINEIYLRKDFDDIMSLRTDLGKQTKLTAGFQNAINKSQIGDKELVFSFLHYDARKQNQRSEFLDKDHRKKRSERKKNPDYAKCRSPTKEETDYLVRLYSSIPSDVLATPVLQGTDGKTYLAFLKDFFDVVDSSSRLKSKPIMGVIPKVADLDLPDILDFYYKRNVRIYSLDFEGGQPFALYSSYRKNRSDIQEDRRRL